MYILAGYAQRRESNAARRVLILDADVSSRNEVAAILEEAGYQTDSCATHEVAFDVLANGNHGVLVAQERQSLAEGLSLSRNVQQARADVNVIWLTGDETLDVAVAALQAGVFDFMTKRFEPSTLGDQLLDALRRTVESQRSTTASAPPSVSTPPRDPVRDVLVGECPLIEQARQLLRRVLDDGAPVLINGEAGTEKQPVARLLHDASGRRDSPFVVVNGAHAGGETRGTLGETPPGTLYYAEVSALDSSRQQELVKRLSELGASSGEAAPRIIGGVTRARASPWEGSPLSRLFGSMETQHVVLPPLRERGRDVVILAEHFAEQVRLARGDAALRITGNAVDALSRYAWPGNVDELRFAILHAASLCEDSIIRVADLPPGIGLSLTGATDSSGTRVQVQSLEDMELAYILRVLGAAGGNKASAARLLGVDRTTLYRKLQRSGPVSSQASLAPRARR
jgi:DNA-binding NtrC family response regulator